VILCAGQTRSAPRLLAGPGLRRPPRRPRVICSLPGFTLPGNVCKLPVAPYRHVARLASSFAARRRLSRQGLPTRSAAVRLACWLLCLCLQPPTQAQDGSKDTSADDPRSSRHYLRPWICVRVTTPSQTVTRCPARPSLAPSACSCRATHVCCCASGAAAPCCTTGQSSDGPRAERGSSYNHRRRASPHGEAANRVRWGTKQP